MLKFQNSCTMEIENLKDILTVIFVIVDDLYNEYIPEKIKNRLHKDKAILSDSEIITISIVGELLGIDSEKSWVSFVRKNMKNLFPKMCERSRFNRTRRNLMAVIEEIRKRLNDYVKAYASDQRIIDSFPLPVCKFGRAHFCSSFKEYCANYGNCASKKETYYGFKVHALCTKEGYITDFIISSASIDDRAAIWELIENYHHPLVIIGDKGYISEDLADDLWRYGDTELISMKKNNAKSSYPKFLRQAIFKIRRRIETTFSQLTEQLNTEIVLAKSFWGLKTRLQTKILAYNFCLFINELLGKQHIARIKELVF